MPHLLSMAAAAAALPSALAATLDMPVHFFNSYANVEVEIGTPAQSYMLHFDTGSSTAWVNDKSCGDACLNTSGFDRTYYDVTASSTGVSRGARASMDYFGGVTGGPTFEDKFSVPVGDKAFTWRQSFLSADQSSWNNLGADGFMGLAFNSISDGNTTTVVETLMQQGQLDEPRFGIYYGTEFNQTGSNPDGVLTIGGSREDKYVDGEITYVPLRFETHEVWRTVLSSITGTTENGGKKKSASNSLGFLGNAVFDTGAGSISVPNSIVDEIYESFGWDYEAILHGKHIPLCSEFNSTWSVTFNFGDGNLDPNLTMTGDQFARPGFAYRDDACYPPFEGSDNEGMALIGTPLMQQFYTIFDFGGKTADDFHPRIGFGQLKKEVKP
ncbi:acid protease [Aspergillus steynii IBT 23096]|uniref:Acid protease n=1 Tax=Aspergillus steynii IBT 23096 TaxID=1392250 RepID=A0A2I2GPS8_9EURO|nr:acid protease [Aspergillus steynii IBT 23096]PLB54876.1 acid protease [Aspergillus steynii IBT 23096]